MKPALSPQTTGVLPRPSSSAGDVVEDVGLGDDRADDLDELLHRGGVEEVDADHAAGPRGGRGDLGDGQRRGVGGDHRRVGDDPVDPRDDLALDRQLLDHGLDDQAAVLHVLDVGGEGDPVEQLGLLLLGQLAAGDRPAGGVLEMLTSARQGLVVLLHPDDEVAVAGEDLGDAGTHRAEADDTDPGEVTRHVSHPATATLVTGTLPESARSDARTRRVGANGHRVCPFAPSRRQL